MIDLPDPNELSAMRESHPLSRPATTAKDRMASDLITMATQAAGAALALGDAAASAECRSAAQKLAALSRWSHELLKCVVATDRPDDVEDYRPKHRFLRMQYEQVLEIPEVRWLSESVRSATGLPHRWSSRVAAPK